MRAVGLTGGRAAIALLSIPLVVLTACSSSSGSTVAPPDPTATAVPSVRPTTSATPSVTATNTPATSTPAASSSTAAKVAARWDHVIVVVEENRSYSDIIGNAQAPYLNQLATTGVSFTNLRALTHPSEPNYLGLFSGSTHGLTTDGCPKPYRTENLATQLATYGYTFTGYAEGLPSIGFRGCTSGAFVRKHCPWIDFANVPDTASQPLTSFPRQLDRLPDLAFVIPDVDHDMHDGTVHQADTWLRVHLGEYVEWAATHRSLLIVTWDEDDGSKPNQIPTIAVGAGATSGRSAQPATLYSVLRTLEDGYGVPPLGAAADARPLAALGS